MVATLIIIYFIAGILTYILTTWLHFKDSNNNLLFVLGVMLNDVLGVFLAFVEVLFWPCAIIGLLIKYSILGIAKLIDLISSIPKGTKYLRAKHRLDKQKHLTEDYNEASIRG